MNHIGETNRQGFTLVEMLVVIVIIGILISLTTAAVVAALDRARETQIKVELDNLAAAFEQYKNKYGSYPPNFADPNVMIRHFKKAFPRSRELPEDIALFFNVSGSNNPVDAAQAVIFWLGGFSPDPEYPITGSGGPSFASGVLPGQYDLSARNGLMEFDPARLGPRDELGNFNGETIALTNGRVVPLFEYYPPKLTQPFIYFDTSRDKSLDKANYNLDPSYPNVSAGIAAITAYRRALEADNQRGDDPFVNPRSFQLLSAGTDDDWGRDSWSWNQPPRYPYGPFFDGLADNLVNFSAKNLGDSQP